MFAVNSSVEPEGDGNELVHGEAVPSSSDGSSDVDVGRFGKGDVDRREGAPHVLIKRVAKRVASLELEAPL